VGLLRRLKSALPVSLQKRLLFMYQFVQSLGPLHFECYVLVMEDAPDPRLDEVKIDVVESRQPLTAEQQTYLEHSDLAGLALWTNLHRLRAGPGFLFLARAADGCYCTYTWIVSSRYNRRRYPTMRGEQSLFLGPVYTDPRYRGQNIVARVMQYAIHYAKVHGYGPFYGLVAPTNTASIRGCDKAGWKRLGLWRGTAMLRDRIVRSHEVPQ